MKKIIAAFDAFKLSESTKDYAIYLSKQIPATLTGIFIDDLPINSEVLVRSMNETKKLNEHHKRDRKEAIKSFEAACKDAHISFSVSRDTNLPIQELLRESIYADLAIINVNETFTEYPKAAPPVFMRQLLAETQCPVLLVPDEYRPVSKITLLYDGSPSSVYAIKMFSSLFEQKEPDVEVLTVKAGDDDMQMQSSKLVKEFMNRHYPQASYTVLKGNPLEVISEYLAKQTGNTIVVMGGHQRSSVVKSFKVTLADTLMWKLKFPLFIASNK